MARKKASGYTKEELHSASSQVMKSLNVINRQVSRPRVLLDKGNLIANSVGRASSAGISKSSKRRRSKKERANLAGSRMEELISTLPVQEVTSQKLAEETKTLKPLDPHKSRKAQTKLEREEMRNFKAVAGKTSLADIKAQLLRQNLSQ